MDYLTSYMCKPERTMSELKKKHQRKQPIKVYKTSFGQLEMCLQQKEKCQLMKLL